MAVKLAAPEREIHPVQELQNTLEIQPQPQSPTRRKFAGLLGAASMIGLVGSVVALWPKNQPKPPCDTEVRSDGDKSDKGEIKSCIELPDLSFLPQDLGTEDLDSVKDAIESEADTVKMEEANNNGNPSQKFNDPWEQAKIDEDLMGDDFFKAEPKFLEPVEKIATTRVGRIVFEYKDKKEWVYARECISFFQFEGRSIYMKWVPKNKGVLNEKLKKAVDKEREMMIEAYRLFFFKSHIPIPEDKLEFMLKVYNTENYYGYTMMGMGLSLSSFLNKRSPEEIAYLVVEGLGDHFRILDKTGRISTDFILPNFILGTNGKIMVIDMSRTIDRESFRPDIFGQSIKNSLDALLISAGHRFTDGKERENFLRNYIKFLSDSIKTSIKIPEAYKTGAAKAISEWGNKNNMIK